MTNTRSTWKRNLLVAGALLISWILLITLEVRAGIVDQLKVVYLLSLALAFGGFIWAWLPASWSRKGTGEISAVRVAGLAVAATVLAGAICLVAGVNYKLAIGGAF